MAHKKYKVRLAMDIEFILKEGEDVEEALLNIDLRNSYVEESLRVISYEEEDVEEREPMEAHDAEDGQENELST